MPRPGFHQRSYKRQETASVQKARQRVLMSICRQLPVLLLQDRQLVLARVDVDGIVEHYREHHRESRVHHERQHDLGRHMEDRLLVEESHVQHDERQEVQYQHQYDAPPLLAFDEIAAEIDNDRDDREQEAVRSAPQAHEVSRYDRVERDLEHDADIHRHDVPDAAEYEAEQVYDDA